MDESKEDFASYITPSPPPVYGPPNYPHHQPFGPSNFLPQENYYPEPIYIPKPQYPFQDHPGSYIPPKVQYNYTSSQDQGNRGQPSNFRYNFQSATQNNRHYNQPYNPQGPGYFGNSGQSQYPNDIWKRKVESLVRLRRSLRRMQSHLSLQRRAAQGNGTSTSTELHSRRKRQSGVNGEQLCAATSNYIVPKAALNNKGNWMYVVNMPEVDNRASQLVKTETCASQTCNGICGLPQGYSSRCEQKYVQKRLVALEGSGNNLYTDVFWFPSCCVCTISNT
ncbi:unnamed protein product [Callosobruchus maculatus]|uniref:Spaetzle domain-containing protein n=2 Tax=Callosobruchus maculatus TaxID=64391 RepID=A0A653CWC4_CALMS|nr:unnamed protein product [Callosobruchus maculatus]